MFYLVLQGVQAIRQRKSKAATPFSSATDSAIYGWGNDPATPKRIWLLRIVYWGTIVRSGSSGGNTSKRGRNQGRACKAW
jgi:hypothetical protein